MNKLKTFHERLKLKKDSKVFQNVDVIKTIQSIISYLDEEKIGYLKIRIGMFPMIFTVTGEIFYYDRLLDLTVISQYEMLPEWLSTLIVYKDVPNSFYYMIRSSAGFETRSLSAKEIDLNPELNYNDDFPEDRLNEIMNQEGSALMILHGEPGTGKSSYIKSVIKNSGKKCLYVDQSCFDYLTDASLVGLLMDFKSSIVILEDCECLIASRKNTKNNAIAALLNLTDGILADAFNLKIICTFNADLNSIDKALLRKGRLKLKYEFKNLTKDKVRNFFEKKYPGLPVPDKEMSLADLYNYEEIVDLSKKERKSVGF